MNHPLPVPPPQKPTPEWVKLALIVVIPILAIALYVTYQVLFPRHAIAVPPSGRCPEGYVKWPTLAGAECCPEGMQCGD